MSYSLLRTSWNEGRSRGSGAHMDTEDISLEAKPFILMRAFKSG